MDLTAQIAEGHGYLGYAVLALVLASVVRAAIGRSRGDEYAEGLPRLAGLVLALQVLYGLIVYVVGEYWTAPALLAYLHPAAMVGAIGAVNVATARAKRAEGPDAWGEVARFQGIALVLVVLGVWAAATTV